jgi:hypothetical protein
MHFIIKDIFKSTLIVLFSIAIIGTAANAQSVYFNENGYITMNGKVDFVSNDEFTMTNNGDRIEVKMDDLNRNMIENMIDADVIERGAYVSVTGRMSEEFGSPVIEASNIRAYNN